MDCRVKPGNDGVQHAATRFPFCAEPERLSPSRPRLFGAAEFRPGAPGGGRFLLRIEDIDATRCRPEFEAAIYEDLAWLGISWETPVRRQSEHFARYREAVEKLAALGLIYPAFESRAEIARLVAQRETEAPWPRDPDGAPLYPGAAKSLSPDERGRLIAQGAPYALRLDMAAARARAQDLDLDRAWRRSRRRDRDRDRPAGSLGRRHPGAQGDADQLSSVGRDRRRPAGRHRRGAGQDLFWSTSVHRSAAGICSVCRNRPTGITGWCSMRPGKSSRNRPTPPPCANCARQGATPADIRRLVGLPE